MITAKIILDSAHPMGDNYRLTTFLLKYPKFIHAEHCRHRSMSLCVSSSRAVPVSKNLEEVQNCDLRASPIYWGREQKGMQSGREFTDRSDPAHPLYLWEDAAMNAAYTAELMMNNGVHKSIVNRILEPFLHVNVLCTVTTPGLMNFFGLRLDKAAQPEIRKLAEEMWRVWQESKPFSLKPGDWHLPFADIVEFPPEYHGKEIDLVDLMRKVSTARCARLSYTSFETRKRSIIEEDLRLYERLIESKPIHASPAEHQATPDTFVPANTFTYEHGHQHFIKEHWMEPQNHGNFPGWIQHRKLLPSEAIAPLPEGYTP